MPPVGRRGSGLLILALVGATVVGVTSLSLAKVNSVAVGSMKANNIALQAYQYADAEAQLVRATAYNDLSAKAKADIQNSNGFQSEVTISAESDYSDTIKQKTATVNIYRSGENNPRVSLNVLRYNQESTPSGVPIGTIIAWPGNSAPTEGGTWLLCNGQSCASYPALVAIVGSTVPNLNGRFLEGTNGSPRSFKDAGLPNITGSLGFTGTSCIGSASGAFYSKGSVEWNTRYASSTWPIGGLGFNASLCSAIYGASDTVQPSSYTVRYYIKAA